MNPDDWRRAPILLLILFQEFEGMNGFLRELFVDFDVRPPMVRAEGGSVRHGVEQGPEGAVAAPIVVAVEKLGFGVDGHDL